MTASVFNGTSASSHRYHQCLLSVVSQHTYNIHCTIRKRRAHIKRAIFKDLSSPPVPPTTLRLFLCYFLREEVWGILLAKWATPGRDVGAQGKYEHVPLPLVEACVRKVGWENQPHKDSWTWENSHALEQLGGVRSGDEIWKHDMLCCSDPLGQCSPTNFFSPSVFSPCLILPRTETFSRPYTE